MQYVLNTALLLRPSRDQSWKWKTSSNEIGKFNLIQNREVGSHSLILCYIYLFIYLFLYIILYNSNILYIILCLHFTMDVFCWPCLPRGKDIVVFRFIIEL